jgi:hypothetical protein
MEVPRKIVDAAFTELPVLGRKLSPSFFHHIYAPGTVYLKRTPPALVGEET